MRSTRAAQSGFTLIEMMVIVSIIGVLGTVVIPSFVKESKKVRYDSEVSAMFAELSERQDMYKSDNFKYHASAVCPAAANDSGTLASTCLTAGSDWTKLKAKPTIQKLKCTYQISTGCPADVPAPPAGVSFNRGVQSFYFIVANCGTSSTGDNYTYFTSSTNPKVQKLRGTIAYTTLANCSL
jgi:prepilin-type N-terminal cleavage/methylation domain-containing protein